MKARWAFFFFTRPLDYLVVSIAATLLPIYYLFFRSWGSYKLPVGRTTIYELIGRGPKDPQRDSFYADGTDNSHNLLTQVGHGFFHPMRALLMFIHSTDKGTLHRHVPDGIDSENDPSRDCLSAFCYFYVVCDLGKNQLSRELLEEVAEHHWKSAFNLKNRRGEFGSRCANGGVVWCNSSKSSKWAGPNGPQSVLSTMALLKLASTVNPKWKWRFQFYRIMTGGFFWERFPWFPAMPMLKKWKVTRPVYFYVGHTTQMNLYVLHQSGHDSVNGLRWIAVTCKGKQGIHPTLGGMAADCGALTEKEKAEALQNLLAQSFTWPQNPGLSTWNPAQKSWSLMAHCAVQLTTGNAVN